MHISTASVSGPQKLRGGVEPLLEGVLASFAVFPAAVRLLDETDLSDARGFLLSLPSDAWLRAFGRQTPAQARAAYCDLELRPGVVALGAYVDGSLRALAIVTKDSRHGHATRLAFFHADDVADNVADTLVERTLTAAAKRTNVVAVPAIDPSDAVCVALRRRGATRIALNGVEALNLRVGNDANRFLAHRVVPTSARAALARFGHSLAA